MALPDTVRVKLSSEAAGGVAMTPVVVRELPLVELLEHAASALGLDVVRIADILKRGSLVSGASRFRWEGWEVNPGELREALERLPKPEPGRAFDEAACDVAVLSGPGVRLELPREFAQRRRFLRRRSFWDSIVQQAAEARYVTYLYKERADQYRVVLSADGVEMLRTAAPLLVHSGTARYLATARLTTLDLLTRR